MPTRVLRVKREHSERYVIVARNPRARTGRIIATFEGETAEKDAKAALPILERSYREG